MCFKYPKLYYKQIEEFLVSTYFCKIFHHRCKYALKILGYLLSKSSFLLNSRPHIIEQNLLQSCLSRDKWHHIFMGGNFSRNNNNNNKNIILNNLLSTISSPKMYLMNVLYWDFITKFIIYLSICQILKSWLVLFLYYLIKNKI